MRALPHPELQQFVKPDLSALPPAEPPGGLSTLAAKRFRVSSGVVHTDSRLCRWRVQVRWLGLRAYVCVFLGGRGAPRASQTRATVKCAELSSAHMQSMHCPASYEPHSMTVAPHTHPHTHTQERAKPSLHARCYLRLGLYEWHHADAAEQHLAHCMDLLRVSAVGTGSKEDVHSIACAFSPRSLVHPCHLTTSAHAPLSTPPT